MDVPSILFNRLLSETAKRRATDLHLCAGSRPVLRKDGRLVTLTDEQIMEAAALQQIIASFLDEREQAALGAQRELTTVKVLGGHFRFKINVYYQKGLLAASFRLINEAVRDITTLGLPPAVTALTKFTGGLVVVAGVYGSGKTTTIGALVEQVNQQQQKRILTLEDPIEVVFTNQQSVIEQREVGKDVTSLLAGLQYCQQEDVDIIVVSDIRDELEAVMPVLLELAASNLVLLEMHADESERVLEKIIGSFAPRQEATARALLADTLRGVVVQRLLPKNGGGQALALEVLLGTPAAASVIREGKLAQLATVIQTAGAEGMVGMTTSLVRLVSAGQISREEALAAAPQKEDFSVMSS